MFEIKTTAPLCVKCFKSHRYDKVQTDSGGMDLSTFTQVLYLSTCALLESALFVVLSTLTPLHRSDSYFAH